MTLIDVLLTVMVIGVLAAVTAPKFIGFYHREQLRAAAQRVATDLKVVRAWAMTNSESAGLTFNVGTDYYKTGASGPRSLNRSDTVLETYLNADPYYGDITVVDFNGSTLVTFNGAGIPDNGGALVVSNGTDSLTVSVNPVTGLPSIQ